MLPTKVNTLLPCCYYFRKPQKIQNVTRPTSSPRQERLSCWMKNGELSIVSSVQGTGGSLTETDPENMVDDQDTGSPVRPLCSGLQVPVRGDIVVKEQEPFGELPGAFFLQNLLQLHQQI